MKPTILTMRPRRDFVDTPAVRGLTQRARSYLCAGYPVHFRGPAGTGKTTLAMHVAKQLGRPVMLMAGDEGVSSGDLIGGENGYSYRKVVDRYIHSVLKYQEDATQRWVDNRLTIACREGFTLVYDEFTRSRPEANNVLLTILEERLLILPTTARQTDYIKVHPEFRIIFTSNPQEYSGVYGSQDALLDRMITIDVDHYDRETEIAITQAATDLPEDTTQRIVELIRAYRASGLFDQTPTLRASLMIARLSHAQGVDVSAQDDQFVQLCLDVLRSKLNYTSRNHERLLRELISTYCV